MGVYKRYIVRNGRKLGPYLYEQKQVNGKRIYKYLGKAPVEGEPMAEQKQPMTEQKQNVGLWDRIRSWF